MSNMEAIARFDTTIAAMCLRRSQLHTQLTTQLLCLYEILAAHTQSGSLFQFLGATVTSFPTSSCALIIEELQKFGAILVGTSAGTGEPIAEQSSLTCNVPDVPQVSAITLSPATISLNDVVPELIAIIERAVQGEGKGYC